MGKARRGKIFFPFPTDFKKMNLCLKIIILEAFTATKLPLFRIIFNYTMFKIYGRRPAKPLM